MKTLNSESRSFLNLVKKAIFTNPFSRKWLDVTSAITATDPDQSNDQRLKQLQQRVQHHFNALKNQGISTGAQLSAADQTLFKYGAEFLLFHQFTPLLDHHITAQIAAGPSQVIFKDVDHILAALSGYGFKQNEAHHTLALFFQMRRSFFFIAQIIGTSRSIQKLRRDLWRIIFTDDISLYEQHLWNRMEDFSTLILGATGTGKGIAARAIGSSGFIPYDPTSKTFQVSFSQAFQPYNLSQIAPQLLESELFGHKKGAFTGAIDTHTGILARCSQHGSIFLDEIGEISTQVQIKLLHTLQERQFSPVGSQTIQRFSGRVIAATNRDIAKMRAEKLFRDDFYYRLCTETIHIPSLAQRFAEEENELYLLVEVVLRKILGINDTQLGHKIATTIKQLCPAAYHWPGNVRELEQCVRRVLLKGSCDFEPQVESLNLDPSLQITASDLLRQYCSTLYKQFKTYEAVARITHLDRRTVKRYID